MIRSALALLTIVLAACGGARGRDASIVDVRTFRFEPAVIRIEVGAPVTWRNHDRILHTVTSGIAKQQGIPGVNADVAARPDGRFDGALRDAGSRFRFTFDEPGRFTYFCSAHSGMSGEVIVA